MAGSASGETILQSSFDTSHEMLLFSSFASSLMLFHMLIIEDFKGISDKISYGKCFVFYDKKDEENLNHQDYPHLYLNFAVVDA